MEGVNHPLHVILVVAVVVRLAAKFFIKENLIKKKIIIIFLFIAIGVTIVLAFGLNEEISINIVDKNRKSSLDFQLNTIQGGKITLSKQKAELILINFWAIRCPYCILQMDDLKEIDDNYSKSEVKIIGICLDNEVNKIKSMVLKNNIKYSMAITERDTPWLFGGFSGVPSSYLVNSNLQIVKKYIGYTSKDEIIKDIEKLLY